MILKFDYYICLLKILYNLYQFKEVPSYSKFFFFFLIFESCSFYDYIFRKLNGYS